MVMTLHNYRFLCASANLYRAGRFCHECLDHSPLRAIRHSCYHDSALMSVPWSVRAVTSDRIGVLNGLTATVFLNDRARQLHVDRGLRADTASVVPNFVPAGPASSSDLLDAWVWVGRLSHDKGILELLRHWPLNRSLHVFGSGPLAEEAAALALPGVQLRGSTPRDEVRRELRGTAAWSSAAAGTRGSQVSMRRRSPLACPSSRRLRAWLPTWCGPRARVPCPPSTGSHPRWLPLRRARRPTRGLQDMHTLVGTPSTPGLIR